MNGKHLPKGNSVLGIIQLIQVMENIWHCVAFVPKQHDEHHRWHLLCVIIGRGCRCQIAARQTTAQQSDPNEAIHVGRQFSTILKKPNVCSGERRRMHRTAKNRANQNNAKIEMQQCSGRI